MLTASYVHGTTTIPISCAISQPVRRCSLWMDAYPRALPLSPCYCQEIRITEQFMTALNIVPSIPTANSIVHRIGLFVDIHPHHQNRQSARVRETAPEILSIYVATKKMRATYLLTYGSVPSHSGHRSFF